MTELPLFFTDFVRNERNIVYDANVSFMELFRRGDIELCNKHISHFLLRAYNVRAVVKMVHKTLNDETLICTFEEGIPRNYYNHGFRNINSSFEYEKRLNDAVLNIAKHYI